MRSFALAVLFATLPLSASAQSVVVQLPAGFHVEIAPPQLRVEVQPPAPAPSYTWVPGYWSWADGRYVWVPGSYVAAPQPGARWIPARWVLRNGGWYFEPGRWTVGAAVAAQPPPPPAYVPPPPQSPPAAPQCRPSQYWDGEKCRHKGKGHGARKHDDD